MSKVKKDIFRAIISKAEFQKPADDMAGLVMQQITGSMEDEVAINPALKSLLKKHGTDAPPMAFTANVMAQINPQAAQTAYKPLISTKGWYMAASVLCGLILLSLWSSSAQPASSGFADSTITQINALPAIYVITITFGGLLMVADHFITSRLKISRQ